MLILKRKLGQWIKIGSNIRIQVSGIRGTTVKLSIKAPNEMEVCRGEIEGVPKPKPYIPPFPGQSQPKPPESDVGKTEDKT